MSTAIDEKRLTEQLWRSYKLKYAVLIATLICLWLVFSAVRTGERAAKVIDQKSVDARLEWYRSIKALENTNTLPSGPKRVAPVLTDNYLSLIKDPSDAVIIDEMEIELYGLLLQDAGTDEESQKARRWLQPRYDQLRDLTAERENAYNLEFGFSNLKNTIVLNALTLIDLWPLLLICSTALVVGISLRQHAIDVILCSSIQHSTDKKEMVVRLAAAGFVVGALRPHVSGGESVMIYKRPLMLTPEPFITVCLVVATIYLSATIPAAEVPSKLLMRSSLVGYHTIVLMLMAALTYVLVKAWLYYRQQIIAVVGVKVFTPVSLYF